MKEYLNINFSDIVYGENGFLVELRCNNIFHEQLFGEIKTYLHKKETEWKVAGAIPNLEQDPKVCEDLERIWSNGQLAVLKKALTAAAELSVGLLEATEVVEPNPIRPNESTSYSNLYHCDRDGVYLYMDTVSRQIEDAIRKSEE